MSKQINQYTKTRTSGTVTDDDLLDLDSTEDSGVSHESAKMTMLNLVNYLDGSISNLYNQDGTLSGPRTVDMDGNDITFDDGFLITKGSTQDAGYVIFDSSGDFLGGLIYDFANNAGGLSLSSSSGEIYMNADNGFLGLSDGLVFGIGQVGVEVLSVQGLTLLTGSGSDSTTSSLLIKNDSSVAMFESRDDGSLIYGNNVSGAIDYIHTFKGDATVGNSGRLMQITDEANNIDYYNFQAGSFRIESIAAAAGGWTNNMSRIVMDTGGANDMVQLVAAFDGTHNLTIQNSSSPSQLNTVSSFSIITNNVTNYFCGDARHALQDGARLKIGGNGNHTGLFSTDSKVVIDGGSYQNALSVLSGRFGVGTETATAQAHIDQASTSGAIPVLNLDQADLSEQFIDFIATEAVGNPIEDAGAKTLTTTKFIRISVNGSKLYIPAGTIA